MTDREQGKNGSTGPATEEPTAVLSEDRPREGNSISQPGGLGATTNNATIAPPSIAATLNGYINGHDYSHASPAPVHRSTNLGQTNPGRYTPSLIRHGSYTQLPQHPPINESSSPRPASPVVQLGRARVMQPATHEETVRYSSAEKGKGRSPYVPVVHNGVSRYNCNPPFEDQMRPDKYIPRQPLRDETNPKVIGTPDEAKRKRNNDHRSQTPTTTATPPPPKILSAEDKTYFERVEANKLKPMLSDMRYPCPVWSNTRRGLQSAVEYLRVPSRTGGASVDIGPGGMARGVILEGKAPTDLNMWTLNKHRSLLLPIGRPRARRNNKDPCTNTPKLPAPEASPAAKENLIAPLPVDASTFPDSKPPATIVPVVSAKRELESPEVEALLMTHRARVPIALAVAQDYSGVPFRVPRPFVALGWFWIVDAWVEPVIEVINNTQDASGARSEIDKQRVVWRFRFEYCSGGQDSPWWEPVLNNFVEAHCPYLATNESARSWPLSADDRSPTMSVVRKQYIASGVTPDALKSCESCGHCSTLIFKDAVHRSSSGTPLCLNESCDTWAQAMDYYLKPPDTWPTSFETCLPKPMERLTPSNLGLVLRPAEPTNVDNWAVKQLAHAGREYWTGWVCHKCGCANERRHWYGWSCEGCKRTLGTKHVTYHDAQLRAPQRPVSTGPRPDDGLATWPCEATFAWTLFEDDVKVVRHGVQEGFGTGTAIYHSLNHQGPVLSDRRINATSLFQNLQRKVEFDGAVTQDRPYKRQVVNPQVPRSSERYLSPFYTVQFGPEPVPEIESLPSERPIPWRDAEDTYLNLADYINERAGQIFPGEAERFNSLLIAVTPPSISATQAPRIFVPAYAFMAFSFFGSDGVLKIRRPAGSVEGTRKQGLMTLQHGDVVGIQTGPNGLEVSAQQDGFGFLCIGRQIYSTENDSIARAEVSGHETIRVRPRKLPNKPPPRPAKLPHVPLTYWYVGPFPLDPERPLRVDPALEQRSTSDFPSIMTEGELRYNGLEIQVQKEGEKPSTPKRLDPPVRAGEGSGRKRKITGASESSGGEKGGKAKVKGRASKGGPGGEDAGSKKGDTPVKKKARKSAAGVDA